VPEVKSKHVLRMQKNI